MSASTFDEVWQAGLSAAVQAQISSERSGGENCRLSSEQQLLVTNLELNRQT